MRPIGPPVRRSFRPLRRFGTRLAALLTNRSGPGGSLSGAATLNVLASREKRMLDYLTRQAGAVPSGGLVDGATGSFVGAGRIALLGAIIAGPMLVTGTAFGQEAEVTEAAAESAAGGVSEEVGFILNSLLFLIGGFLVMFMAAG